jgi:hypothetical protein
MKRRSHVRHLNALVVAASLDPGELAVELRCFRVMFSERRDGTVVNSKAVGGLMERLWEVQWPLENFVGFSKCRLRQALFLQHKPMSDCSSVLLDPSVSPALGIKRHRIDLKIANRSSIVSDPHTSV